MTVWNASTVRELEWASIRRYLQKAALLGHLAGDVLDYGCGRQPYRAIVEGAGGRYVGYDRDVYPGSVAPGQQGPEDPWAQVWDAIICTQVVQYVPDVLQLLYSFEDALRPGGALVITWPTCWDEIEHSDLHRFTRWGMERLFADAGLEVVDVERRAEINLGGFRFPLGYGAIVRATR